MDKLQQIRIFVAVVDCNGFAGAARKLRISPPVVTRAINELENELDVRLLTRTTRVVLVTEPGARYVEDCRRILAELSEADESVSGMHGAPSGRLSLTAPVLFGALFVTPIVAEYLQRYPEVSASCLFLDRLVNMMDEGMDVAVRIGDLPDSSMQAIRVGQVRRVICAAPAYLERRGVPESPGDLVGHDVIVASAVTPSSEWKFVDQGRAYGIKLAPRLTTSTNDSAIAATLGGLGLSRLMSYQVADRVRSGELKIVLSDYEPATLPVHVLHREGRHAAHRVRSFLDLAIDHLRANPAIN
ncbi:MAG: LysR family transcriptional regulator [Propionivibrio sp.]|uniref:LysR family transcriptional regulator n=1 Tax=Candidatus Propionivibrio dominans TaxID=2954373 RepID=A0A9D7F789_9RHOO|nr:LysR family transcriptional regulator [Candidatus Propionivibrio dominans]MBL0167801.1 LysR family transcriptional regulator [Propionivibrio sp.]